MYSIRLEGDTQAMLRKIRSFSEIDKKSINAALAEGVRESTLERFKKSRDPSGKRWKTSIRAETEGGKTLIQSAQLRNSIKSKSDATGFAVGTNVKHAATHQFGRSRAAQCRARRKKALRFRVGGKWVSKKQVRIRIPARPFSASPTTICRRSKQRSRTSSERRINPCSTDKANNTFLISSWRQG
mgnify:CR=1 FL=1